MEQPDGAIPSFRIWAAVWGAIALSDSRGGWGMVGRVGLQRGSVAVEGTRRVDRLGWGSQRTESGTRCGKQSIFDSAACASRALGITRFGHGCGSAAAGLEAALRL